MTPGAFVLVNCVQPKEQFWGILQEIHPAGVIFRGLDLRTFDDWVRELSRHPDDVSLGVTTTFLPLHRIERMFLDERVGQVPSYCEQFEGSVGRPPRPYFAAA